MSQVTFQVGDALNLSLPDGHFDVVWSMECGEHITDKAKVVNLSHPCCMYV